MLRNSAKIDEIISFLTTIADERARTVNMKVEKYIDPEPENEDDKVDSTKDNDTETLTVEKMEAENYDDDMNELPDKMTCTSDLLSGLYPGVSRRVIDVLMTSLLNLGSKTFTHSFLYIDK